jgi:hypothetical protein
MAAPHTRQFVREGVAAWLVSSPIPNLANVYASAPRQQDDVITQPGQVSGANAYLIIQGQKSQRITMGAAGTGYVRREDYRFNLLVTMLSNQELSQDAESDNDALLDGIKALILSDNTMGGALFWAADGESSRNSPDVQMRMLQDGPSGDAATLIITEITFSGTDYYQV